MRTFVVSCLLLAACLARAESDDKKQDKRHLAAEPVAKVPVVANVHQQAYAAYAAPSYGVPAHHGVVGHHAIAGAYGAPAVVASEHTVSAVDQQHVAAFPIPVHSHHIPVPLAHSVPAVDFPVSHPIFVRIANPFAAHVPHAALPLHINQAFPIPIPAYAAGPIGYSHGGAHLGYSAIGHSAGAGAAIDHSVLGHAADIEHSYSAHSGHDISELSHGSDISDLPAIKYSTDHIKALSYSKPLASIDYSSSSKYKTFDSGDSHSKYSSYNKYSHSTSNNYNKYSSYLDKVPSFNKYPSSSDLSYSKFNKHISGSDDFSSYSKYNSPGSDDLSSYSNKFNGFDDISSGVETDSYSSIPHSTSGSSGPYPPSGSSPSSSYGPPALDSYSHTGSGSSGWKPIRNEYKKY